MSWVFSITFICLNHPLSLGCILLIQTILLSLAVGLLNMNFWFSYILFLIMIGGMLVLFIYMTSIASNEKFKFSSKLTIFILIGVILSSMMLLLDNYFSILNLNTEDINNQSFLNENLSLSKYLNKPSMLTIILLIIYLLITLIAVVKISYFSMGPLRQKF
uniref:NADH-ubiquinone oxidoreductase chain 6 n=1 Tax=Hypera postica TaxID=36757 RepID=J9PH18_9CUCU|nr:NADH dehydrogenase subunit 6 [Hypera postica]